MIWKHAIENSVLSETEPEELRKNDNEIGDQIASEAASDLQSNFAQRMDPQKDGQIYSDILQAYVDPCCYQIARLNDEYCMCGKAINYLKNNQNTE